jgi:hypothetical protein
VRQRRTDLFAALSFQVAGLIAVNELHRGEYALPLLSIALSAYAASALASLYVLVVTEFKPVAFETASFSLWIVVNAAFVASMTMPLSTPCQHAEQHDPRDFNPAGMRTPGETVRPRNDAMPAEVRAIKTVWPSLPEDKRKKILELAAPENALKESPDCPK